jgi:hypothetical protein
MDYMDIWERRSNERGQAIQKAIQKERGDDRGQTIQRNTERHATEREPQAGRKSERPSEKGNQ